MLTGLLSANSAAACWIVGGMNRSDPCVSFCGPGLEQATWQAPRPRAEEYTPLTVKPRPEWGYVILILNRIGNNNLTHYTVLLEYDSISSQRSVLMKHSSPSEAAWHTTCSFYFEMYPESTSHECISNPMCWGYLYFTIKDKSRTTLEHDEADM